MTLSIAERRLPDDNPDNLLTRQTERLQGKLYEDFEAHLLTFCEFVKLSANDEGMLAFSNAKQKPLVRHDRDKGLFADHEKILCPCRSSVYRLFLLNHASDTG
jgi:hypothetical protein